ncbi:gliding motility-associated C-terminal domain-containing protein [Mucilaginibacter sp.]|uniref:gliding motility-associated C-terminal domain-containing protein n=1 Tax=Mucilaginibacter sp. TaxID=1882438 RepID=UPI002842B856|nr:gliding motility-associated C-terminal domain-containing protein [Mucilaginibacter sp.]MDR3694278.1 gliding motility-associated C-terminal domain-containing protein [Mucilaginibacter sp.]
MIIRKLLLFLLLLFIGGNLFAATFTVTSNADAGAGTLRQALLDAIGNGTATTDYIYFNLPGNTQAAITITLQSELPDISANVIIDGTTQPGSVLGVSGAKVIITPTIPAANFNALKVSTLVGVNDAVEIYGLYIEGFSPNQSGLGSAIVSGANCKLVVGAPGKGNVISGNDYAFNGLFQNAVIQSNFIGIQPDGITAFNNSSVFYSGQDYQGLMIGGANPQDGNVILGGRISGINFGGIAGSTFKIATVENNLFNTDYTGTKPIGVVTNSCILVNDPNTLLFVTANVFSATEIAVVGLNKSAMIVKGNFFGTDRTQAFPLGSGTYAIENSDVNSVIGGTAPADQNVFTNYQNPIDAYNNSYTDVVQNIFYCNTNVQLNDPTGQNFIRITTLTNTTVSGDAPIGATVQLYFTQTKCTTCNPNSCFATVIANAAGRWSYTGSITQNVLASSTVANNTIGFQFDAITQTDVNITNFDCHHAGSIALIENRVGNFQFTWTDSNNVPVSTSQNATGLQPGNYTLQISENGGCPSVTSSVFTVIDLTPKVFSSQFTTDCTNPTGHFTTFPSTGPGITVANYYWEDASGNIIPNGNSNTISNLAPGTYYLYITDSNGCNSNKATFVVVPPTATPVIDAGSAVKTEATCGLPNGSVTGINLTNAGNANFGWNRANGTLFSAGQMDLQNAPAGQYYFFALYNFNCPPVKSELFTINAIPVIQIAAASEQITSDQCSEGVGSIQNVLVTGGVQPYTYNWINSSQQSAGTSLDLTGVVNGTYTLQVKDATACGLATKDYTIGNQTITVAAPVADNVQLCYAGDVMIMVKNPQPGYGYRLYATATGADLIDQESSGIFKIPVASSESVYISQYIGGCESSRTAVKITVGLSALNIPNTFTPNNDGVNDFWLLKGIENYPEAMVRIFNRYGQKVFESRGYTQPFDGKIGGSLLQPGVYYYIINLNSNCSLLSGSITLVR